METRLEGVLGQVECWLSMQWSAGLLETMLRDEVARARAGMAEINAELRSRLAERSESGSSLRGAA